MGKLQDMIKKGALKTAKVLTAPSRAAGSAAKAGLNAADKLGGKINSNPKAKAALRAATGAMFGAGAAGAAAKGVRGLLDRNKKELPKMETLPVRPNTPKPRMEKLPYRGQPIEKKNLKVVGGGASKGLTALSQDLANGVLTDAQIKKIKNSNLSEAAKNAMFERDMRKRQKAGLPR